MATLVLAGLGAGIGSSVGGSFLGFSMTSVGRFAGAVIGRSLDAAVLGQGSEAVERGRLERAQITQSGEGLPIAHVFGRTRVGGQVIWASQFFENKLVTHGQASSKSRPASPDVIEYQYSVSLAIALCWGEITHIAQIWADGVKISPEQLSMQVYKGSETQRPDPALEAIEGMGQVPAYRGLAYVVFENLSLAPFGNRVPQFSFEICRPAQITTKTPAEPAALITGVSLIPGTGEYALARSSVYYAQGLGKNRSANENTPSGLSDFQTSLTMLEQELPKCKAVSLVVSWFGSDLRCAHCRLRPKVEQAVHDGVPMPWQVSGLARAQAAQIPLRQGRSVYGGTPADASVLEAIEALKEAGQAVMFYPFILMDQGPDNLLPDPYSDQTGQAAYPWRGRITLSKAPNQPGSPDRGPGAAEEIAAFFGQAQAADFTVSRDAVSYSGPADDWGYNRFILHYAALCARAGGVAAFCIGSEMRGLSAVRDQSDSFLAVAHLQDLAQQVRRLLGPEVKLGYAADWSEYFGYRPAEADGDMIFHLDPLWSSSDIDFIGIDNYMPLSDWRDGIAHKDAAWGSLYDLAYLTSNIAGGEGYDWYYPTSEARNVQSRKPIEDTAHDEAWIWRYKDLKSWWSQKHYNRINGLRSPEPTQWQPKSKPIWFTELGVAAVDKATNQPNVFFDPKSSESALPYFSVGQRDDYIQMQYLRALHLYWAKPEHNPESDVYSGRMLDRSRMFVWTWDARPFPYFPAAEDLWADGENYARGHWITGRVSGVSLAAVVAEICERSGLFDYDVSDLHGYVRGYKTNGEESARGLLQPLALHFGFDAVERQGVVRFLQRGAGVERPLDLESLVDSKALEAPIEWRRDGATERVGRLQQSFALAEGVYDVVSEEVQLASDSDLSVSQIETGLVLTRAEARQAMQRWLVEARLAKDTIRFALPPSQRQIGAGDRVRVKAAGRSDSYRIDRVELGSFQTLTAVRSDAKLYQPQPYQADRLRLDRFVPPLPVFATFLDLPSLSGDEQPQAPYVAVSAQPWPGRVAVYASDSLDDYALAQVITRQSYIGRLCSPLPAGPLGLIDMGTQLLVEMPNLQLSSIKLQAFLAGRNKMAIGDGSAGNWEIVQFQFAALRERGVYQLSGLLRGLHGSDAIMPAEWPSGSLLVTLDQAPPQIWALPIQRGIERHFRIGPAAKPLDDPIFQSASQVFLNNLLRPYRPCHLQLRIKAEAIEFAWLRRGRVDADMWHEGDIPLAEAAERYRVRILAQSEVLREAYPERPVWTYENAWYISDLKANNMNGLRFEVAQLSDRFGPGPSAYMIISENLEIRA